MVWLAIPPLKLMTKNKSVPKYNKKLSYGENLTLKMLAGVGGSQIPQNILDIMVPIYSALPQKNGTAGQVGLKCEVANPPEHIAHYGFHIFCLATKK